MFLGRIAKYSEIVGSGCFWKSLVMYWMSHSKILKQ
jgi:hypothetical protein